MAPSDTTVGKTLVGPETDPGKRLDYGGLLGLETLAVKGENGSCANLSNMPHHPK